MTTTMPLNTSAIGQAHMTSDGRNRSLQLRLPSWDLIEQALALSQVRVIGCVPAIVCSAACCCYHARD